MWKSDAITFLRYAVRRRFTSSRRNIAALGGVAMDAAYGFILCMLTNPVFDDIRFIPSAGGGFRNLLKMFLNNHTTIRPLRVF